jgi:hypothetical protein
MTKLVVAFHNVGKVPSNGNVPGRENTCIRSSSEAALNLLKPKPYTPYIYRDGIWKLVDH